MNAKWILVSSFLVASIGTSAFARDTTITLSQVIAVYDAKQPATVTAEVQSQSVTLTSTVRLTAKGAAVADTKSFTSATAQQDAQTYLQQTYCVASQIQAANITVENEGVTSTTTLHPASVTSVEGTGVQTNGARRSHTITLKVTCPGA